MARKMIVRLETFKDRLYSAYRTVESVKGTHGWLIEHLAYYVWKHEDYKRLTRYEQGILEGMRGMLESDIREKQYFAYDIEGKPTTFEQWRKENPDADPSIIFRRENGHFYWNDTEIKFY